MVAYFMAAWFLKASNRGRMRQREKEGRWETGREGEVTSKAESYIT